MGKLYLDIDGVLLTKRDTSAADGAYEFIEYITSKYDCYWLTTHCRDGKSESLIKMLSEYFPDSSINKLKQIKPSVWDTLKTEAIDFDDDFIWLDDYAFESEKN